MDGKPKHHRREIPESIPDPISKTKEPTRALEEKKVSNLVDTVLKGKDPERSSQALEQLAEMRELSTVRSFVEAYKLASLSGSQGLLRSLNAEAGLLLMCPQLGKPAAEVLVEQLIRDPSARHLAESQFVRELLVKMGEDAVGPLLKALDDSEPATRRIAVNTLAKIGGKEVEERLSEISILDSDPGVRTAADLALSTPAPHAKIVWERSMKIIWERSMQRHMGAALTSPDPSAREKSIEMLGHAGEAFRHEDISEETLKKVMNSLDRLRGEEGPSSVKIAAMEARKKIRSDLGLL